MARSQFFQSTDYAGQAGAVIYDKATGVLSYRRQQRPIAMPSSSAKSAANLNLKDKDFFVI